VKIGWEVAGTLNADKSNAILVTHFFSGTSHAFGKYAPGDKAPGYWDAIIGRGKAIDTNKYYVLSSDTLVNLNAKLPNVVTTGAGEHQFRSRSDCARCCVAVAVYPPAKLPLEKMNPGFMPGGTQFRRRGRIVSTATTGAPRENACNWSGALQGDTLRARSKLSRLLGSNTEGWLRILRYCTVIS
jgi:hypothetical protein